MSQFDIAIGLDHTTLDKGIAQLYADPSARQNLFKHSETGSEAGLNYTASFDLQAPPTFAFEPPPADKWAQSINTQGLNPKPEDRPTQNAFQLVFPQFQGTYQMGTSAPVQGTAQAIAYCVVGVANNQPTLSTVAVWLDESQMKGWDKFILNQVILKQVLTKVNTMLAGLKIPPLSFSRSGVTVDLMTPVVAIAGTTLILASSLKTTGKVDITGVQWPAQPLFVLISGTAIQTISNDAVQANLVGKTFSTDGSVAGGTAKYSAEAKVDSVTITSNAADRTQVIAEVGVGFDATLKPFGIGGPCSVGAATSSL